MPTKSQIRSQLACFDGRDVTPLQDVAVLLREASTACRQLLALAAEGDPTLEIGATWVLKRLCEEELEPTPRMTGRIVELLGVVGASDAVLHVLQLLPLVGIPTSLETVTQRRLLAHIESPHKFIRAWAYNGLALLARQSSRRRDRLLPLLEAAAEKEAASVKARLRHAMRDLGKPGRST